MSCIKTSLLFSMRFNVFPSYLQLYEASLISGGAPATKPGNFLILGSASLELLQQSSETLVGRIAYEELSGLLATEVSLPERNLLWLRGGFLDSFLAMTNEASLRWRQNFISTYLERDVPQFGPRIPAITLRRLWTMLAHNQGEQINVARLGNGLDVTAPTAKRYLELLEDLLLIRTLRPWSGNIESAW